MELEWSQVKDKALTSVDDPLLYKLYPHVNLVQHRAKHQHDGVYADEVLLLATALAGGAHVIVFDIDNKLLYSIKPNVVSGTMVLAPPG